MSLEHPSPTYQQSEPSYVLQPQNDLNLNQKYATVSYVQGQIPQNIAHQGREEIQNFQPNYSDYPQISNIAPSRANAQYVPSQVHSANVPLKQDVGNVQKYTTFAHPSAQNLYQDIGPNPVQTGLKNPPSTGYKVREIQSEDQPNPVSFLQSDDSDYFTSGFGHPFHFSSHDVGPQQHVAPQQIQKYQNTYNVFTDSVQNPSNQDVNAYRPPQQVFMNSGL